MISRSAIVEWNRLVPWPSVDQVEQDLVLSRLIVEIANDPLLGDELVFRGGTCLHKIVLPRPFRYSEDIDYVRVSHGPIGPILDALRRIAEHLGMDMATDVRSFPKAKLRGPSNPGPVRCGSRSRSTRTRHRRPALGAESLTGWTRRGGRGRRRF